MTYIEGDLGYALAPAGRRDEALYELERLEQAANKRYVPPVSIGLIHAALGDLDGAFEWIEKGVEINDSHMWFLARGPGFESIRDDPRWMNVRDRLERE